LKQVVNSYSARISAKVRHVGFDGARTLSRVPRFPNYVWLVMIILTVSALSYSAYSRAREQEREARASYNETSSRVENAKSLNRQIKEKTTRIRQNPEVAAQAAQNQLRLIRRNEVVISLR
jgi:cell division protein FtsB